MRELTWHDLSWSLRRSPAKVLELLKDQPGKVFLGGGFIRACVANEHVNDIDLFTTDKESARAAARFLLELKDGEDAGRKIHESDNAFTVRGLRLPVQIIHRWTYTSPEELMQSFDFTIAMAGFWWHPEHDKWVSICDDRFYEDLAAKRLIYTSPKRNEDAGGSMLRVLKFYQRDYRIPLDSLGAVLARLVSAVDLDSIAAVRDSPDQTLEGRWAFVMSGLLREVDPNVDPQHLSHLPSENDDIEGTETA